jgi:hypothetical protein
MRVPITRFFGPVDEHTASELADRLHEDTKFWVAIEQYLRGDLDASGLVFHLNCRAEAAEEFLKETVS